MKRIVLGEERKINGIGNINAEIGDTVVLEYYPTPETKETLPYEVMVLGKKTTEEGKTLYLLGDTHTWCVL